MNQNCSSNYHQKLDNTYFRDEFNKTKLPQKHKSLGKKIKDRQISQKDYDNIISLFVDIYYHELYFINKPSYFFLGGFLEKRRLKPGVKERGPAVNGKRDTAHVEFPITIRWSDLFFLNYKEGQVRYIKLRGKRTRGNKIEELWKKKFNFYDLKEI